MRNYLKNQPGIYWLSQDLMNMLMGGEQVLQLAPKRLIFTVTTGRSGTRYLAYLLGHLKEVSAYHEPPPAFQTVMREALQFPHLAKQFWLREKLPRIALEPNIIYIETSHVFCKGFVEPLLELGITPDLILLSRPHREVARSLYALNTIPGRSVLGLKWCVSPTDPQVLPVREWKKLHDYQLCYWYCLEIERRQKHYGTFVKEKGGRVVSVKLSELKTYQGYASLINHLDLPKLSLQGLLKYFYKRTKRINKQTAKKQRTIEDLNFQELEDELRSRLD